MDDEDEIDDPLKSFWMEGDSLAPPCQAEYDVIGSILSIANLDENSVIYDLGCGDGRICIEATIRYGSRSCGVEIEDKLVRKFQSKVDELNLHDKVTIISGDLRDVNLDDATVIVLYLLPEAVKLISPKLIAAIRRGCLVICNSWGIKELQFAKKVKCGPYNNVDLFLYNDSCL